MILRSIALAVLLAVAVGPLHGATADAPLPVIRMGVSPVDGAAPLFYAKDAGVFTKYGVDVEFVTLSNGSAVLAGIAGGSIDLGLGSPLPLIEAYSRGLPFTIIGNLAVYRAAHPDSAFLVRADSSIRTPKDLEGKTLGAASLQDLATIVTMDWLASQGVDRSTTHYVEMPSSTLLAAMEQHRIDGAAVYEPFFSDFVASGKARVLGYPYSVIGKHYSEGVLFGMPQWVSDHHDAVDRFLRAMREAEAYTGAHEREVAPITARYTGTNASALMTTNHVGRSVIISVSDIQPIIDVAAKYKLIPSGFAASDLICTCALSH